MKYLTYESIATTNEWTNPSERELRQAKKKPAFREEYRRVLERKRIKHKYNIGEMYS